MRRAPDVSWQISAAMRRQAAGARYVTSVCTGSLVLGAAGLLKGYKSACHRAWRDMLIPLGAEPVAARIVRDRNRITGGGVTAGIDFGLVVAAELAGEEAAKLIQLALEYDPQPPFDCGSPEKAGADRTDKLRARFAQMLESRRVALEQAQARLA
jgi:cyclohexyl-isocyanide hydratase